MDRIDTVLIQGREWPFQHRNKFILLYITQILFLFLFLFLFYEETKTKTKQNVALYSTDLSSIVIIARVLFTCQYKKWAPLWFIGHFLHVRFRIYLSCHSLCTLQTEYVISLKILGVSFFLSSSAFKNELGPVSFSHHSFLTFHIYSHISYFILSFSLNFLSNVVWL